MSLLAIFNPEHDLCLANGNANYVAPESARLMAAEKAPVMRAIYGDCIAVSAIWLAAAMVGELEIDKVVAWGWNATLKRQLVKYGIDEKLLSTDAEIDEIRRLSHRGYGYGLRNEMFPDELENYGVKDVDEIELILGYYGDIVMKAPWSGAGRGLRWVRGSLSDHDKKWVEKIVLQQGMVMVEPRYEVVQDFALEYWIDNGEVYFCGYSLFNTANGVYRENEMIGDEEILERLAKYVEKNRIIDVAERLTAGLEKHVAGRYKGPLGIDMFTYRRGGEYYINPMVEMNFRHTMGHVAVAISKGNKPMCRVLERYYKRK